MANLWSGRFSKKMDKIVEEFNASIGFDINLFEYDIMGSKAHVTMLADTGIIKQEESDLIKSTLDQIKEGIKDGSIVFSSEDEDIHMAIEKVLISRIGEVGKKLHTARSRNDQTILDTKLYVINETMNMKALLVGLLEAIVEKAEKYKGDIMPGFTHLQHAQPVSIGFHMMAYFQKFKRDISRLDDLYERLDECPLGSCALAGTTLPIDRFKTAQILGFSKPTENAMDSISERDFVIEFIFVMSMIMTHLSRFCEEFIIWNSQEFSYVDIDDAYCTGSSIMPQKKNPDIPELIRGKAGRVYGSLMALFTIVKGLPLAFNKDFQEDKENLFDSVKTCSDCIYIFTKMLEKSEFNCQDILKKLEKGFIEATDLAEDMVAKGIAFRDAHELVGKIVKYCECENVTIQSLEGKNLEIIGRTDLEYVIPKLGFMDCVNKRDCYGGTALVEVERQIKVAKEFLSDLA